MVTKLSLSLVLATVFVVSIYSCRKKHDGSEIIAAMKKYDHVIQKMDADSIALMFTQDGNLGNIAHGRDSIRKFLSGFKGKGIKVLSTTSTTQSIILYADSAIQTGSYKQTDKVGDKDTVNVKGKYKSTWYWDGNRWLIRRMITFPAK